MNKLTKLLSVFVIAGAIGTGVAGAVGCQTNNGGKDSHDYTKYEQIDGNEAQHKAICKKHEGEEKLENHDWNGNECSKCHYTKSGEGEGLVIPANVTGILIEGVSAETITLSETKKSHTIDKSAIHVYFATGANADQKGDEVPVANVVLELKDGKGATVSSWENIKTDGQYKVNASIKDATMASGATATVGDLKKTVTVTISNPVVAGSLVVKAGEGVKTTQVQSTTNEILPTWTFEVTLASGDKQDVPASEVTVSGLDTTKPTENGVATLTWGTVTGTQSYTITADATKVAQSFAVNFGTLTDEQKTKLKTEDVSIQNGRFVVQATSGEVADHRGSAPDYESKYLASRLKLGGKYDGDNAKRYVKITTDGAATITVYAYANSGTAGAGDSNRYLSLFKNVTYGPKGGTDESKIVGTGVDRIGEKQNTKQKENSKHEWSVTEAGTYWLVCEDGDVCVTYIQVDQLVAADEGVEAVTLTGETKLAKLSVSSETKDYKQTFTVGDTFSVSNEYTLNGVYYNNVTMEKVKEEAVTTGVTYWLGATQLTTDTVLSADLFENLGENKITVKVDGETETASYTIIVESAVPGVTGIEASLKDTVNTVLASETAKLTLNKTDIEATIVGENENATLNITAVKYRLKTAEAGTETEITESVELGAGEYVIVVVANVADATAGKNADFEATVALKVDVEGNGASWLYQGNSASASTDPDIAKDAVIDNNGSFTAKALVAAKSGYNQNASFNDNITNASNLPVAAADKTASGEAITFKNAVAFGTKGSADGVEYLEITAKKATTIYVYLTCSDDGHKSNREGASVYYSINGTACATADEVAVTKRTSTTVLKVTLAEGDVLKVGVKKGSAGSDPRVWLYGIEAVDVTAE